MDLGVEARRAVDVIIAEFQRFQEPSPMASAPMSVRAVEWATQAGTSSIALDEGTGEVVLSDPSGDRVIASGVSPFFAGETPNGIDDNGNGLIDENGLSIVRGRGRVRVMLSLERPWHSDTLRATASRTIEVGG